MYQRNEITQFENLGRQPIQVDNCHFKNSQEATFVGPVNTRDEETKILSCRLNIIGVVDACESFTQIRCQLLLLDTKHPINKVFP